MNTGYKGKGNSAGAEPQLRIWRDKKEFGKSGLRACLEVHFG